jgi:hypothetical protein
LKLASLHPDPSLWCLQRRRVQDQPDTACSRITFCDDPYLSDSCQWV